MPNSDSPTQPNRNPTTRPFSSATDVIHGGRRAAMSKRVRQYSLRACPVSVSSIRATASRSEGSSERTVTGDVVMAASRRRQGGELAIALKAENGGTQGRCELRGGGHVDGDAELVAQRRHHARLQGDAANEGHLAV